VVLVNGRSEGVPRYPLNWRALLTGTRWGVLEEFRFDGTFAKKGQKFSLEVPGKKSSKRLLLEIFGTVVHILAELCLNKNWGRLR
jgi:hypothetical protein